MAVPWGADAVSAKPTGLAAFTRKGMGQTTPPANDVPAAEKATKKRGRAQGETVALTVRLRRAEWARLHQLAVAEGVSLQSLALSGFSAILERHGLPPIEE